MSAPTPQPPYRPVENDRVRVGHGSLRIPRLAVCERCGCVVEDSTLAQEAHDASHLTPSEQAARRPHPDAMGTSAHETPVSS